MALEERRDKAQVQFRKLRATRITFALIKAPSVAFSR